MNLNVYIATALESLRANKLRTALTLLGVTIGVAAVIALVSIGNSVRASITSEFKSIGTDLIKIMNSDEDKSGRPTLSSKDMAALSDRFRVPAILATAASVESFQQVTANGVTQDALVTGVTSNYFAVNNLQRFRYGDGLIPADEQTSARVAVLGADIALELFPNVYPVGKSIRVNGTAYKVVGVLADTGSLLALGSGDSVFVPLSTARRLLYDMRTVHGEFAVTSITVQAIGEEESSAVVEQINSVLRDQHNLRPFEEDDFDILTQSELLKTVAQVTKTLTAFLGVIAGISLLVGGIGIMNIMLVSITERTREIGIRKAVGALKRDILLQFLLESMTLSLVGAVAGILIGWLLAALVGWQLRSDNVAVSLDLSAVALAVGFAIVIGVVFGIYPAWRAANLAPIEALRYE